MRTREERKESKDQMKIFDALIVCCALLVIDARSLTKPTLTLDEFFKYTDFVSVLVSPTDDQSVLIRTKYRNWNESVSEFHLDLYSITEKTKKFVAADVSSSLEPLWNGEWIIYADEQMNVHFYSTRTGQRSSHSIGEEPIHAWTLSPSTSSLYFATRSSVDAVDNDEWKDVIQYREDERGDTIYRLDLRPDLPKVAAMIANVSLRISEMICSSDGNRLIFSTESKSGRLEKLDDYELFSLDLNDSSARPRRLTTNRAIERHLRWCNESVFFMVSGEGSIEGEYEDTQGRVYSLDTRTNEIHRWAGEFPGHVKEFNFLDRGRQGLLIVGQWKTEVQIYNQRTIGSPLIEQHGWVGTYEMFTTASVGNRSIFAFIHSSFDVPQEVYTVDRLDRLVEAEPLTTENRLFTERNLPRGKTYRWFSPDDQTEIEGILLYPPDRFEEKNLSMLVLIHGGPYNYADLNAFRADWYSCAVMMATDGWLVFQPNYRGTGGYGDRFLNDLLPGMVSRPGKDILAGVDALVRDGIADPTRMTIGGYSYGGYLTNWLITQTTRFNAAVSGAGGVETVSDWGTNDEPLVNVYYLGGTPWENPQNYRDEAAIFQVHRIRTPIHLVTGDSDVRVPTAQSFIFERALRLLGVPSQLLVFPDEGHDIDSNPWHEKIKVREELKWLRMYGHIHLDTTVVVPCQ